MGKQYNVIEKKSHVDEIYLEGIELNYFIEHKLFENILLEKTPRQVNWKEIVQWHPVQNSIWTATAVNSVDDRCRKSSDPDHRTSYVGSPIFASYCLSLPKQEPGDQPGCSINAPGRLRSWDPAEFAHAFELQ